MSLMRLRRLPLFRRHGFLLPALAVLRAAIIIPTLLQNKPNVLQHSKLANNCGWVGTEIIVCISGNWTTYKVRPRCLTVCLRLC